MFKSTTTTIAALLGLTGAALATDLNVDIESAGKEVVTVLVGQSVPYTITGELSDAASQGLAMFAFDLAFDGGRLQQADAPTAGPMLGFATPLGINNPAGFGGTPVAGRLVQVGGAQNTIRNTFAPKPSGSVTLNVAQPGAPVELVQGTLTAPTTPGTYRLEVEELFANVVRAGSTGFPFWQVDAAGVGLLDGLTIEVEECGPVSYCTPKPNSQGCLPTMGWSGTPTLGGADDLFLTATNVVNNQFGLLFWGESGPANKPFMGGIRCVENPVFRTPNSSSGGNPPPVDCSGTLSFHFSHAYMAARGLQVGDAVNAQYWFRDPSHPDGTGVGLTDAVEFLICP